ncbi:hypothetical protein [Catenulispora rubra]|uniref:hypothetical protein n=1 Tax=Catenulispora rubra TaxID=280293 RepID=UPI00189242C4|nr:hypothetical protein [Catenulispora rubra]
MRRTVLAGVGVVVSALVVSGCASRPVGSGSGPGLAVSTVSTSNTFAPVTTKNDCTDYVAQIKSGYTGPAPKIGPLPASAHPVSLLECVQDFQDVAGQGQFSVVNTVRSTGSVDAFVSALRAAYVRPPEPTPQGGSYSCAAIGYTPQWLALIDADGTVYRVEIPFWGVCSAPDRNVTTVLATVLAAVPTKVTSTERIRQTVSPGAKASGCEQQFAEMAFVGAQLSGSAANRPFFAGQNAGKPFRVCYYKLTDTTDKTKPAGDFETATIITGTPATTIYDGLTNAPTATNAKNCTSPATEYAVLFTNSGAGDWSVVELNGCKLAGADSGPDREVPAPVMQVLVAAKGG